MWSRSFLILLSIQQYFLCIRGSALRKPQHKQRASHWKSKVKNLNSQSQPGRNAQDLQCAKNVKEKYGKEAVAIEKCAEGKGFEMKLAQALKLDNRHDALDICEDVLMNCVGLSLSCAKQQIPLMLDRAQQKKANGQSENLHRSTQLKADKQVSERASGPTEISRSTSYKESSHSGRKQPQSQAASQKVPSSAVLSASQDQNEIHELCHHNGLRVVLDKRSNSRRMTFGDNAWEKLIQTAVNCKGAPAPTCLVASSSSCDLSLQRCPCEFQMQKLPPLDHEYIYIADQVLKKDEATSDQGFGSIRGSDKALIPMGFRMALVGLGGGMIAQYLISHSTQLSIDAIELNPDVIAAGRAFFGVAEAEKNGRLHVLQGDGISMLSKALPASYGVVVVDCFGDGRVPAGCRSEKFAEAVYHSLQPGAEVLQNVVVSQPDNGALDKAVRGDLEELLQSYRKVFGERAVELQSKWAHGDNAVIKAQKGGSMKAARQLSDSRGSD